MQRFVNADIIVGEVSDYVTLNRYAYANGNPVSNVDPFGLSVERGKTFPNISIDWSRFNDGYFVGDTTAELFVNNNNRALVYNYLRESIQTAVRPNNIGVGTWNKQIANELAWLDDVLGESANLAKGIKIVPYASVALESGIGIYENINNDVATQRIVSDAVVDVGFGLGGIAASTAAGAAFGTIFPGAGNVAGAAVGFVSGVIYYALTDVVTVNGKSAVDWAKTAAGWAADNVIGWFN